MRPRHTFFACSLAAIALSLGCSEGQSVLTGNGVDATVSADVEAAVDVTVKDRAVADDVTDVPMDLGIDATMDAPPDAPGPCTASSQCTTDPGRAVCDTSTGRCVQCVASPDSCPATDHCNPMTNTCEPGCRSDEGCVRPMGLPDGGVAAERCDTAAHRCVQCITDAHCPPGNLCVGNVCAPGCNAGDPSHSCPTGQTCCAGACVDGQSNLAHCGMCNNRCGAANATPICLNGTCGVGSCMVPFGDCDMVASNGCETDTRSSLAHCGACGNACPTRANATSTCDSGRCGFACNAGFADCDMDPSNGCEVDTRSTVANCGRCGGACSPPNATPACVAGACAVGSCDDGFGNCDMNPTNGCETNVRTNVTHCGTCGNACPERPNAFPGCVGGRCVISCVAGFADCDGNEANGCEVDTRTDRNNCGACARACSVAGGMSSCEGSVCRVAGCDVGRGDCDMTAGNGCETDLVTSVSHCGGCGMACPARANASSTCASGACGITCNAGFGNCDAMIANGCETNTTNTVSHCGACGRACSLANATPGCASGACTVASCDAGYGNCDGVASNGCETDTRTSASHCGACGTACNYANATGVCRGSTCSMGACNAGFSDCDYNPANGCETAGSCSYASCNAIPRAAPSGVYTLTAGGTPWRAYCDMTSDGGGWTLLMKVPGRDGRFLYSAPIWTDTSVLNDTSLDLSTTPAKFVGFSTLPFTQLRLGMVDGSPRYITVNVSSTAVASLRSIFAGGTRATTAGRAAWRSLLASPSLQPNCNSEGFNLQVGTYQAVRLGILTNQENDCNSPDSRIGFGGQYNLCGAGGDQSCGNVATCAAEAGDRDTAVFGFIFAR